MEIDGLVLRPQFDLNKFKVGAAVHVKNMKDRNLFGYQFAENCLITDTSPLSLTIAYASEDSGILESKDIPIRLVAEGSIKIDFLKL